MEWKDRAPMMALSIIIVLGFIAACVGMFIAPPIAQEMKELSMLLLGVLAAGFTTTINFWFGSSSSGQKKDETIAQVATTKGTGS